MIIGFYIHHSAIKAGGYFTYSLGILKLLLNSDKIEKVYLIYSPKIKDQLQDIISHKKIQTKEIDRNAFYIKYPFILSYFLYDVFLIIKSYFPKSKSFNFLRKLSFFLNPYRFILNPINIDLFHVPMQFSPVYNLNKPIIVTMHDVQEMHYPEFFSPQERLHRALNSKKSIDESSHIIVSFNHIKNDLLKYFGVKENKVSVCPPPFSDDWFANSKPNDLDKVKEKYKLSEEFILYPAATWQHKNHLNLILALDILRKDGINVSLVCTGNKTNYFDEVIQRKIKELNFNIEVKFLGIIPESDLISLYKLTKLVVIPTIYEAGSGPLYEAMRYEIPVICSNITSLPETMDNKEFLFNPKDVQEISIMIKKGIKDNDFRKRNIENSRRRINYFRGLNFETAFIDTYNMVIQK